ncbi:MAG TPA: dihydropyrimidinase, partial [Paraburkholderia sp.]
QMKAWPALTLSRGDVVWDGAQPRGARGRGEFLPALRAQPAQPRRPMNPRIDAHRVLPRFAFPAVYRD